MYGRKCEGVREGVRWISAEFNRIKPALLDESATQQNVSGEGWVGCDIKGKNELKVRVNLRDERVVVDGITIEPLGVWVVMNGEMVGPM